MFQFLVLVVGGEARGSTKIFILCSPRLPNAQLHLCIDDSGTAKNEGTKKAKQNQRFLIQDEKTREEKNAMTENFDVQK